MSRNMLSLSPQQLTSFDLETFMTQTAALNQRNAETYTTPFPKAPTRWLSHYNYRPRPIAFTQLAHRRHDRLELHPLSVRALLCTRRRLLL